MSASSNWDTFARVNASQRWRRQSAAMGRAMTDAIVVEARVERGMHVLDVASGTGEPAISIAGLLAGTGRVVATDISEGPLKVGEARARERSLTNIEFVPADVHQLPFPDGEFDRVTCRLGVMFFNDLSRALREVRRVLKPGGRASLLAWGAMQQPYFETTLGTILRLLPGVTMPPSGAKMFQFGEPNTLSAALRDAGFERVEEVKSQVPWNWPGTPEDLWEWFQEVTIPFKPLFEAIPAGCRAEVTAQVHAALSRYYSNDQVRFAASIVLASAIR
jgi:ubiquinone/menaquinone biosynthesis C-methylase UbiE